MFMLLLELFFREKFCSSLSEITELFSHSNQMCLFKTMSTEMEQFGTFGKVALIQECCIKRKTFSYIGVTNTLSIKTCFTVLYLDK